MAHIGNIFIAGKENFDEKYKCGISFSLSTNSTTSYIHETVNRAWQVELTKGSTDIVARTSLAVSYDELQNIGFAVIQEALDIISVKGMSSFTLSDPARSNIGVYQKDGRSILFSYSLFDLAMGMQVEITQTDAEGNEIKPPPLPEPVWNESFRYYRLSQASRDLFEAYKNLFLAFEALLNAIFPKKKSEGEVAWLKRCLSALNKNSSLAHYTPTGVEDPIEYIINSQYKNTRCRLQHAKFPAASLPHSTLTPSEVQQAYEELIRIWRHIAGIYFNTSTYGGVITYAGFASLMKNAFNDGASIHYTTDNSPPQNEDTQVSPSGHPTYEFTKSKYLGQIKPGVVRTIACEAITKQKKYETPIHRICTRTSSTLMGVTYIKSGLMVLGVDEWQCIHDIRLINISQPKIEFTT